MRMPEFSPLSNAENKPREDSQELQKLRQELKGASIEEKRVIIKKIIAKLREEFGDLPTNDEEKHFAKTQIQREEETVLEGSEFSGTQTTEERETFDLIEERAQLRDAILTLDQGLTEVLQEDPENQEMITKLQGMRKGSRGLLEEVETELKRRGVHD